MRSLLRAPVRVSVIASLALSALLLSRGEAQATPVRSVPEALRLEVPGAADAYYYKPKSQAQRPIVMVLHGRGADPEEDCRKWAKVAAGFGWVVCPSGPAGSDHHRSWTGGLEGAKQVIDATVDALRAKYKRRVKSRGNVLIGFSEGAFIAQQIGVHDPDRWNRWLILAASDEYWSGEAHLLELHQKKIRRVFLFTGEHDQLAENTLRAGEMLKTAHIPFRVRISPGLGHEVPAERMIANYRRPLRWLISAK